MKCTRLSKCSDRVPSAERAYWLEWSVHKVSLKVEKWFGGNGRREGRSFALRRLDVLFLWKMQPCCERSTSRRNECGNEWVRRRRVGSFVERVWSDRDSVWKELCLEFEWKEWWNERVEWVSHSHFAQSDLSCPVGRDLYVCVCIEALSSALHEETQSRPRVAVMIATVPSALLF